MRKLLIWIVRFVSMAFRSLGWRACRFHPTCSAYAAEALTVKPLPTALGLIVRRFFRCHPFSAGGFDPLPDVSDNPALS